MRKIAAFVVACAGMLIMAGTTMARASAASSELNVSVTGGGSYSASAATAALSDGGVTITCAASRSAHGSTLSGKIAGGSHQAHSPVAIGTVAALSFRNCRTSQGATVTEHAESLPYKLAIDSPTNSKGQTDGVVDGIRIMVTIASTRCSFLVTGSAPGFVANSKRLFSLTSKLPVRALSSARLTVGHATRCSGHIRNGDHPALTTSYALSKKVTIRSVIFVPHGADLSVTNRVDNSTPNVGAMVTFTVTLTDLGPDQATNVTVKDLLPSGLSFVSATPSQGTYDASTGTWTVGTMTTSAAQILGLTATVETPGPQTSTASISHSDQPDPDKTNNSASVTIN